MKNLKILKKFSNKIYIEKTDGTRKRIFPFRGLKGLRIKFSGENSTVVLKEPLGKFKNSKIKCANNCFVEIGASVKISGLFLSAEADRSTCIIGKKTSFNKNTLLINERIQNNLSVILNIFLRHHRKKFQSFIVAGVDETV